MKRRTYLKTMLAAATPAALRGDEPAAHPIQLHLDLDVDPAKEEEMLHNFRTVFRPAASHFPGYIDVKMLKLRSAVRGTAPSDGKYRFVLTYQSEEMRQKWVASDIHKKVWL